MMIRFHFHPRPLLAVATTSPYNTHGSGINVYLKAGRNLGT